ncbi:hypothetical protein HPB48_008375 [Haemaphysalis longicornis]|uniref:Uncharacterized protein n=1 Tax=Haemaphysalis longicornis TaxID=44386 RepID=A0A9J6FC96_HAELO|nr:hypothetical protein HPB48_008375 [Haemaphysalis longicornis]
MRMVSQLTNRHDGMKEEDVIKLVQALVVSRVVYSSPYLPLKPREMNQIKWKSKRSQPPSPHRQKQAGCARGA